jgi:hypothetical protein
VVDICIPDEPSVVADYTATLTEFSPRPNGRTFPTQPSSINFTTLADGECQKVK